MLYVVTMHNPKTERSTHLYYRYRNNAARMLAFLKKNRTDDFLYWLSEEKFLDNDDVT